MSEGNLINIETKVQTIYFEDTTGNIVKHHEVRNQSFNITEAEKILQDLGINLVVVLRVLTERIDIQLTRQQFDDSIVHSERFYQRRA